MEINVVQGRRSMICSNGQMSPDRRGNNVNNKACVQAKIMKPAFKKVQVVYYLSRNGHLEHPHYMEVTHLAHQQLRLKDVIDRLAVLRGKGMPWLYSWSCKRSYKNGYVWNDLAENDVIYPSERGGGGGGAEYVLKGSELLLEGCTTEKLHQHHLQISSKAQVRDPNFQPKRKSLARIEPDDEANNQYFHYLEDEEEETEYEEKTRCSRGVSTDEIEEFKNNNTKNTPTELPLDCNSSSSPPSTTSSSTVSEKTNNDVVIIVNNTSNNNDSSNNDKNYESCTTRFEDGDPVGNEPLLSRNSMLLSLIACGGSGSFRKTVPPPPSPTSCTAARKSGCGVGDLHRGVVCRVAAKKVEDHDEEEMVAMIGCMSENPRFGNLQAEEKEYFSGSIVEAITTTKRTVEVEHGLKKSNSHNEERSTMSGLGEATEEKEVKKEKAAVKGKCIPRMIKPSSSKQTPKK